MRRAIHSFYLSKPLTTHLPKIIIAIFLCLALFFVTDSFAAVQSGTCNQGNSTDKASILQKAFRLQIPFIANEGQIDRRVRFYAQTFGGKFYLTEGGELVYTFSIPDSKEKVGRHSKALRRMKILSIREQLMGASQISLQGVGRTPTKVNYFTGNDRNNWKTNIPTYNTVSLGSVYEGIELSLKAYGDNVEKIFTVQPGADFNKIMLQIEGATDLKINNQGELEIKSPQGVIRFSEPRAYQEKSGKRQPVQVAYRVHNNAYGFNVTGHDPDLPLIIDPCLSYSTYLGGAEEDSAFAVAVHESGNVYVGGFTLSTDFLPTPAGVQKSNAGNYDGFITKLNPDGTIAWSTYLGGELDDAIYAIAVDSAGSVYVTGETGSKKFPTAPARPYDAKIGGNSDLFVAKIKSDGTDLVYSTYLGGGGPETGYAIAVNTEQSNYYYAYVAGETLSSNFPVTPDAYSNSLGNIDAFVVKFNEAGTDLLYSTYIGGSGEDKALGLAVNTDGQAHITGQTTSSNFNVTDGSARHGASDAFVVMFNTGASNVIYSTYLGGAGDDAGNAIAIDDSGNLYVAGQTSSADFPGAGSDYSGGLWDAFVAKLDSAGTGITYSTYIGGSGDDIGYGIAVDADGNIFTSGETNSFDLPEIDSETVYNGSYDAFLTRLSNTNGDYAPSFSAYFGGAGEDAAYSIALDTNGNVYLTGATHGFTGEEVADSDAFLAVIWQEDTDLDGIADACDNCPTEPNGPALGTCTIVDFDNLDQFGQDCDSNDDCGATNGFCSMSQEDFDESEGGDACDEDDDNDELIDIWEITYGEGGGWLNPQDPDTDDDDTLDGDEDFDEGGLLNIFEQENESNPHLKDSDGDFWSDLMEVQANTSPIDINDSPGADIFAAGIYVDKSDGSELNLGTEAYPLKSIHAAFERLNMLEQAHYTIRFLTSGAYSIGAPEPDTPLVTSQNVTLNAAGVTMDGAGASTWTQGFVFSPLSSNVTIDGLHIVNFNEAVVFNSDGGCATLNSVNISTCRIGLQLVEAYQLEVDLTNSQIAGCETGVEFAGEGSDNTVSNGTIQGNALEAVKVSGGTGNQFINSSISGPGSYGLKIEMGVEDFTIKGGMIQNTDVGLSFATDGASITVSGATIQNCRAGIEFLENYMVHLDLGQSPDETLITGCEAGILFTAGSSGNSILNGTVRGNVDGIRFERCAGDPDAEAPDDNQIIGTKIEDNTDNGIAVVAGSGNQLSDVTVTGSETGVYMGPDSSSNVLRGGSVSGNNQNFNLDGSNNTIEGPMTLQNFGQVSGKGNNLFDLTLDGQSTETYGLLLDQGSEEIILRNVTIQNYDVGIGYATDAACLRLLGVTIQYCRIGMDIRENYMLDIDLGDTVISNCSTGIEIAAGSSDNIIRNGTVQGSTEDGILVDGCNETPDENQIIGITIQDSKRNGIALLAGFGNEVIGCTVTGNNSDQIVGGYGGIALLNGSGAVKTSRIYNNGCTGVYLDDSAVADIADNLIYGNPEGIRVALVSDVTIASNTITANEESGLAIEDGALPLVSYNILYGNGTGEGASTDVSLEGDFNPANLIENNIGTVNQIDLPPTNLSVDPLFCVADPSGCDAPVEDYSLQRTSLSIDGTTITEPGIDLTGSNRPKGNSWDMGAIETSSFRDADDDGLPDPWEEAYFGGSTDCNTCGADDDYDGDGVSNLQEYQEGSRPDIPVYVRITSPATSPQFTNIGSIEVSGISVNADTITVTNGGTLNSGLESWNTIVNNLAPGANVILVTASGTVDSQPYEATDTITVVKDSASPTVTIISPSTEGTYTTTLQSITLSGLANDDTEVASVSWAVVGDPQSVTASGTISWTAGPIQLPQVTADPVSITVRVTATDIYNITGSEDIVITRVPGANNVDEDLSAQGSEPSAEDPLDVDGDGYLNDDEIACGSDPLMHPDNYPGTGVAPIPSNYGTNGEPTSYQAGHEKEGYLWPDCLNPDIDGDGMPNWWEEEYFAGSPTDAVDVNDDDGDGLNNLQEYQGGTNPTVFQTIAFSITVTDTGSGDGLPEFGKTFMVQATWTDSSPAPAQAIFSLRMTSNYPGRAENDPDPADMVGGGSYPVWYDYHGPDFGLTADPLSSLDDCNSEDCFNQGTVIVADSGGGTYEVYLHSWDYGGRTKVLVTDPVSGNYLGQLWVPVNSDKNGISSAWTTHGDLTGLDPNADTDAIAFGGAGYSAPLGDDFTYFEEYRGIIRTLSGFPPHLRLNPFRKDLFIRAEGFSSPYNFVHGDAFANAGINVHDTTNWGHDATEGESFFVYFGEGTISEVATDNSLKYKKVIGLGTNWSNAWPRHEWEFELNSNGVWMPVGYWSDSGTELGLDFEYGEVASGSYNYRLRKPVPHINVLIISLDTTGIFGSPDGHIRFVTASPPSQQNPLGTRYWRWATKGYAWCQTTANQASMYGLAVTLQTPLERYFHDAPYVDDLTWGNSWDPPDGYLNPLSVVEDQTDQLDPIDGVMGDGPDGNWDGDRRITTFDGDLSPFDIDGDGLVELPLATDPTAIIPGDEFDLSRVLEHTITHEMSHALAGPSHTNDPLCLMYRYSNNWSRQDHLSDYYKSLLRIHNVAR